MTVALDPPAPGGTGPVPTPAPTPTGRSAVARLRSSWGRWGRYAVTSLVATGVSEAVLLAVYGGHLLGASAASVVASLAGMIPSYAMSRFWIWPEADRRHPGRQAAGFWVVGVASLVASSLMTGIAAALAPSGHTIHVAVVGVAYVGTYGALWILKFGVYQRFLFRPVAAAAARDAAAAAADAARDSGTGAGVGAGAVSAPLEGTSPLLSA